MEVVVVTRAAVERDGWPYKYDELRQKAEADVGRALRDSESKPPEYAIRRMSLGDLTQAAYQKLDLAFFRKGDGDLACLIAQAWT
jgi:hypothetical protein